VRRSGRTAVSANTGSLANPAAGVKRGSGQPGEVVNELAVRTGKANTDTAGEAEVSATLPAGIYRAVFVTKDANGRSVQAVDDFQVVKPGGDRFPIRIPFFAAAPKWVNEPGQPFTVLWGSGYQTARACVEHYHDNTLLKREWSAPDRTQQVFTFTPDASLRGYITGVAAFDTTWYSVSKRPEAFWFESRFRAFIDDLEITQTPQLPQQNNCGGVSGCGGSRLPQRTNNNSAGIGDLAPATVTARKTLQETAFFYPHLTSNGKGEVRITFTMPEALTKWKFLGFAHDKDLRCGTLKDETITAKDLMLQPNPPRFLREGDVLDFTFQKPLDCGKSTTLENRSVQVQVVSQPAWYAVLALPYRSTPYEQLRDQLTDRQVPNHAYVEKVKTGRQLDGRQARQLLAADRAQRDQAQRQQRLEEIQTDIAKRAATHPNTLSAATTGESKEIARLHNAGKRHEKYRRQRALKIDSLHQLILHYVEEKSALKKQVSRIDQLISQQMLRMDLSNKTLIDAIKITARNLFYRLFAPFKIAYDNYRDDHDHYRQLTQCDGVLRWTGTEIEVHLVPQGNYPPKLR
jgi:hypothetical protein